MTEISVKDSRLSIKVIYYFVHKKILINVEKYMVFQTDNFQHRNFRSPFGLGNNSLRSLYTQMHHARQPFELAVHIAVHIR